MNDLWYLGEGDYVNAGLSGAAMGWGATGGKLGLKGAKAACFVAGTKILTPDGDTAIEEIEAGDTVLSKNEKTGEVGYKKVTRVFEREVDTLYTVYVGEETIETTEEHPFWVEGEGWVAAKNLRAGDRLVTAEGSPLSIDRIVVEKQEEPVTVYNFEVEEYHTYFVSGTGVLVHNTCEEIIKVGSYEQARNKAFDVLGDMGRTSPYVGRLRSSASFGQKVGRESLDKKARWRLDYDPIKGPHINVEDFRNGKQNARKVAIKFEGNEATFQSYLKHLNR